MSKFPQVHSNRFGKTIRNHRNQYHPYTLHIWASDYLSDDNATTLPPRHALQNFPLTHSRHRHRWHCHKHHMPDKLAFHYRYQPALHHNMKQGHIWKHRKTESAMHKNNMDIYPPLLLSSGFQGHGHNCPPIPCDHATPDFHQYPHPWPMSGLAIIQPPYTPIRYNNWTKYNTNRYNPVLLYDPLRNTVVPPLHIPEWTHNIHLNKRRFHLRNPMSPYMSVDHRIFHYPVRMIHKHHRHYCHNMCDNTPDCSHLRYTIFHRTDKHKHPLPRLHRHLNKHPIDSNEGHHHPNNNNWGTKPYK